MEAADIPEGESRWFCPSCEVYQVRGYIPSVAEPDINCSLWMTPESPINATIVVVIPTCSPRPELSADGISTS